ncbi:MAG: cephalosporin hydroxylase family protein [Sulfurimonas sp.]|nr:cephalosporin hydroxylase family protein [Sulfurimonas sp.]
MTLYLEDSLDMTIGKTLDIIQKRIMQKTTYFGVKTLKNPMDYWVYQEIIFEHKPDVIIEIGNNWGGSTLALAHLLDNIEHGRIIGIDIDHSKITDVVRNHPRIHFIENSAIEAFSEVQALIEPHEKVLLIEDSSHTYENTLAVLKLYSPFVKLDDYIIVEDSICHHGLNVGPSPGPYEAVETFVQENQNFVVDREKESFLITWNPKGFLRKIRD